MMYEIGYVNDIGKVRNQNQDRIFYKMREKDCNFYALICVADGMGGLADGAKAAYICTDALEKWWDSFISGEIESTPENFKTSLYDLFYKTNQIILDVSSNQSELLGSTCTAAFVFGSQFFLIHAGDTRAYQISASSVQLLTTDHSLAESPSSHSDRLVNFMGNPYNFCVDIYSGDILEGDILLICSDGLYKYINTQFMSSAFLHCNTVQQGIDNCVAYIYRGIANDNISAVALKLLHN